MLLTRRLRNQPITAVRFIRAAKYFFAENITVPHEVEPRHVIAIQQDLAKPLLGTTEQKGISTSTCFIRDLLRSMAGFRVLELHPWLLSSVYTFAYFVISRREKDEVCMDAYDCMLRGETPTTEVIQYVVNDLMLSCGDLNATNDKNCEVLAKNQIHNFRRSLQRSNCIKELQILAAWPEDLGLICRSNECSEIEDEMRHYFKLFEINYITVDTADKLNNSDNLGTNESSVNNFLNLIEDNNESTSSNPLQNIVNNLGNCRSQDENEKESNVNNSNLRPHSDTNNELHKIKKLKIIRKRNTRLKEKNEIKYKTRSKSKNEITLIDLILVDQESKEKSKKVNENKIVAIKEFSCSRVMPFEGKTIRKPRYGGPERPIEINNLIDTPETSTDLDNNIMQLDIVTIPTISNDIDEVKQQSSNKIQDILVHDENLSKTTFTDNTVHENITALVNKTGTSEGSLIAESSNKNTDRELESACQNAKEKADILFNDIDTKLVSSTYGNEKSSQINPKRIGKTKCFFTPFIDKFIDKFCSIDRTERQKKQHITDIRSTPAIIPKSLALAVMCNVKRNNHNAVDQVSHTSAIQNSLQAGCLINQPQDPLIKKITRNSTQSNCPTMNSPICVATTSNLIANNNNSGSISKEASITVVDLEFEQSMLNSKEAQNSINSSSTDIPVASKNSISTASNNTSGFDLKREFITVVDLDFESTILNSKTKRMCFESRYNSHAMDFSAPVAVARDSTSKRKSITVVDLDFEPSMLNSDMMNQELQDLPNMKSNQPDSSPAMDMSIAIATTNSNFSSEDKDSSSYLKKVIKMEVKPDVEIIEIGENKPCNTSVPRFKMSKITRNVHSLTPGPFEILHAQGHLRKYSKGKTAAIVDKAAVPWINRSLSSQKQNHLEKNCQPEKALINEPEKELISQIRPKEAVHAAQASSTEMNEVNPVDQNNSLQDQQQSCLLVSCNEDDTLSLNLDNVSPNTNIFTSQGSVWTSLSIYQSENIITAPIKPSIQRKKISYSLQ